MTDTTTARGTATKGMFTRSPEVTGADFHYYGIEYSVPVSASEPERRFDWYDTESGRDALFEQFERGDAVPMYRPSAQWVWTPDPRPFDLVRSRGDNPRYGILRQGNELAPVAWFSTNRDDALTQLGRLERGTLSESALYWSDERPYSLDPDVEWRTAEPVAEPVADVVTAEAHALVVRELELMRERLASASADITDPSDPRLTSIWERAASVADDEGFCPEYERLANGLGVPGRPKLRRGVVTVTFNVYAYATATSDDDAETAMEETVREALKSQLSISHYGGFEDGSISHLEIESAEADDLSIYN